MANAFQTIAVCGAGTMGTGIAQLIAQSGYATILFDTNPAALEKAGSSIRQFFSSQVEKQKLSTQEAAASMKRIRYSSALANCTADLIIEAIIELLPAKVSLFNQLADISHGQTIFATNTSSLSVSAIAASFKFPSRIAGLHFFNPPTVMKLVEIIKGKETAEDVVNQLVKFTNAIGKIAVICKDAPGFIVNRVARPYYLEALKLLETGIADIETIDKVMEASGFRMGPFRLMDLIGNDINLSVTESLYHAFDKPDRFRPSPIQEEKVKAGRLGRKTGKGYYDY